MRSFAFFASLALIPLAASCGDDESFTFPASAMPQKPAVPAAVTTPTGYFRVWPDLRMCPFPACGGFWVALVDREQSVCGGGKLADPCYVATLELDELGIDAKEAAALYAALDHGALDRVITHATIEPRQTQGEIPYWTLRVHEAWLGAGKLAPFGRTALVHPNGGWIHAVPLNDVDTFDVIAVAFAWVTASPEDIARARLAVRNEGLMVTGYVRDVFGWPVLIATQFYFPVRHVMPNVDVYSRPAD